MTKNTRILCLALAIATTLTACDDGENTPDNRQYVAYGLDKVIYPNDLLLTDGDGTIALNQEAEGEPVDYRDYNNVYGALDGWSTGYPMVIPLTGPENEIDPVSLADNLIMLNADSGELLDVNVDFRVELTEGGDIRVLPMKILPESTRFVLALTDGVTDTAGRVAFKASLTYQKLLSGEDTGHALSQAASSQIQSTHSLLADAVEGRNIIYSTQFTTQSIYPVMEAVKANIPEQPLRNLTLVGSNGGISTFEAVITVPYYLEIPNSANCKVAALYPEGSEQARAINADPIHYCAPLYSWWKDGNGSFVHGANPTPLAQSEQQVPVLIYAPDSWDPRLPSNDHVLPASIFVHGITGWKESAQTMAKSIIDTNRLVIAIDQPLHGERGIDLDGDGKMDITATSTEDHEDKSVYLNLLSPLTLRDNQRQAVVDQLALRKALNSTPFVDNRDISLIGHSLGGIVSTMVSELSQSDDELTFSTVNLVVPGMHLTDLVMNSDLLGDEVAEQIKNSSDIQLMVAKILGVYDSSEQTKVEGLNALAKYKFESEENKMKAEQLEQTIYEQAVADMFPAVQAAVDAGDPANFTTRQANNPQQPILLLEAAGTCDPYTGDCQLGADYLPDTVVPNKATGLPLAGTDPLIEHLSLRTITERVEGEGIVKGAIRVMYGGHGTYLFPYEGPAIESEGKLVPAPIGSDEFSTQEVVRVTQSMKAQQTTISQFIASQGTVVDFNPDHYHSGNN